MKTYLQEILRWTIIALFGGCGLWTLLSGEYSLFRKWEGGLFFAIYLGVFFLIYSLLFLAVAYFCLRRQYRNIFLVVGVAGCILVYGGLTLLPRWIGFDEFVGNHLTTEHHWLGLLLLPVSLLSLFVPIYAAAWFYRLCRYLAYRGTDIIVPAQKTRATGWLVGLGLCLIIGAMLTPLINFSITTGSPSTSPSIESVNRWIYWCMGLWTAGTAMMIVGLVWRRPVVEQRKELPPINGNLQSKTGRIEISTTQ